MVGWCLGKSVSIRTKGVRRRTLWDYLTVEWNLGKTIVKVLP